MLVDAYQVRYLKLAGTPLSKEVVRRGKIDVTGAKRRDVGQRSSRWRFRPTMMRFTSDKISQVPGLLFHTVLHVVQRWWCSGTHHVA